jgi:hypothetical protein
MREFVDPYAMFPLRAARDLAFVEPDMELDAKVRASRAEIAARMRFDSDEAQMRVQSDAIQVCLVVMVWL